MSFKGSERKCFTFTWKLENASYCLQKKGEKIVSPAFQVAEMGDSKWKLWLYPRGKENGNYIGFYLHRETDTKGAAYVEIWYDLAVVAKDGSILKSVSIDKCALSQDQGIGSKIFQNREEMFVTKRSKFLPQDTLTVRCRIWKTVGEMTEDYRCTARTRIGVQKRSFLWKLENFSSLETEKKYTYQIESPVSDAPLKAIDLFVTGGVNCDEIIRFELSLQDKTIKYSTLRLYLVDTVGTRVECNQDEFWFDDLAKCKQFSFSLTGKLLKAKKNLYLPGDVLSLYWEWALSKGIVSEEIEEIQYGCTTFESKTSNIQNANDEEMAPLSHTLNDKMKSLYDDKFLCDVKLKTNTSVFPAHKVILSASSSVFKAMFSSDMKEKDSNCVDINDLSDDAVSGMLRYMYTARVDDLTWKTAYHLYVAADKYAILSMKDICSSYMKDNLTLGNVCEVLLLSDLHSDGDLKSAVQEYILKHVKDIVNSDEWKLLMETNSKLAAVTICLQYK
ncbi:TD and POZ domain-containing protein 5 [Araneus ventricosus]|uniref:TD and POZ domain-containing protein 5 n=1 Tax=Araneus ventricosus TaxID=182803 RepID=A0A4Y2D8Q7_ARAVE|nr:TD and POZ domain-containing protein 5 [Araneus ventricosus]